MCGGLTCGSFGVLIRRFCTGYEIGRHTSNGRNESNRRFAVCSTLEFTHTTTAESDGRSERTIRSTTPATQRTAARSDGSEFQVKWQQNEREWEQPHPIAHPHIIISSSLQNTTAQSNPVSVLVLGCLNSSAFALTDHPLYSNLLRSALLLLLLLLLLRLLLCVFVV